MADSLDPAGARQAEGLVPPQCFDRIIEPVGEASRQERGVLDCLSCALGEEREHGVCCITQEGDAAAAPARERRAVEQRPPPDRAGSADEIDKPSVPPLELREELL